MAKRDPYDLTDIGGKLISTPQSTASKKNPYDLTDIGGKLVTEQKPTSQKQTRLGAFGRGVANSFITLAQNIGVNAALREIHKHFGGDPNTSAYQLHRMYISPEHRISGNLGEMAGDVGAAIASSAAVPEAGIARLATRFAPKTVEGISSLLGSPFGRNIAKALKYSAGGAIAGNFLSPWGERKQGMLTGAIVSPLLGSAGDVLRKVITPTTAERASEFGKDLMTRAARSIRPNETNEVTRTVLGEEGGPPKIISSVSDSSDEARVPLKQSELDKYANQLKDSHDMSEQRYRDLYNASLGLAKEADKKLPLEASGINILQKNKLRAALEEELEKYPELSKTNVEKIIGRTTPNGFEKYLKARKDLNAYYLENRFNPSQNAGKLYSNNKMIAGLKNALDDHFEEMADRLNKMGNSTASKSIANRKFADAAYSKHQRLFYRLPKAARGDVDVYLTNLRAALKNKGPVSGNLISENFTKKPSVDTLNKLSSMLGGKEGGNAATHSLNRARDAMKLALFSRNSANNLTKEEADSILNKYNSLNPKLKEALFNNTSDREMFNLANKWKNIDKYTRTKDFIGHRGIPPLLGAMLGYHSGIPGGHMVGAAVGALLGHAGKKAAESIGKRSIRQALSSPTLSRLRGLVDTGHITPSQFSSILETGGSAGAARGLENSDKYRQAVSALAPWTTPTRSEGSAKQAWIDYLTQLQKQEDQKGKK